MCCATPSLNGAFAREHLSIHVKTNSDAVEAHSCVDPLMPNSFLSKTQLLMINQLQDVLTQLSPVRS